MRTLVVLPPCPLEAPDRQRAIAAALNRFGRDGDRVELAADAAAQAALREDGTALPVHSWPLDGTDWLDGFDNLVFIEGLRKESELEQWRAAVVAAGKRLYAIHMVTRVRLEEPRHYDSVEYPAVDAHLFNRLSRRANGYLYQPYGPVLSDVELGAVNCFGFRVPEDYRTLARRDDGHKVIAVFGGSSAFSYYCFDHETFSAVLETVLNQRFTARGLRFSVLNFGMHDNVVMQETINYLVHVQAVRPDVVIAHDGHNDMYYGLQNDPLLVNDHAIIYQRLHQDWAKLVQGTQQVETAVDYSIRPDILQMNLPDNVIDAYVQRKHQFQALVKADGGHFVWGVQPLQSSKGKLSRREILRRDCLLGPVRSQRQRRFARSLDHLYDMLSRRLAELDDIRLVDFHRVFAALGEEHELFWDFCHLSPEGDHMVAQAYVDAVAPLFET